MTPPRSPRRALTAILLTAFAVALVPAGPALADPAMPTHYRSTVTDVAGEGAEHVDVEVTGGDAFLVLRVEPGVEVQVPGYDGEPYLRVDRDGVVWRNERSPARWLNDERYGASETGAPPPVADVDAAPSWERIADGGEYAWHDHRIHYMSPSLPRNVDAGAGEAQHVFDWEVDVDVAGQPVAIIGELVWLPGPPVPALFWAAAVLLGAAIGLGARRGLGTLLAICAAFAAGVGGSSMISAPTGAEADPAFVVLPTVALIAAFTGARLRRRGERRGWWLVLGATAPLLGWILLMAGTVSRPMVPGPLPVGVVRAVVLVGCVAVVAVVTAAVRRAVGAGPRPTAEPSGEAG